MTIENAGGNAEDIEVDDIGDAGVVVTIDEPDPQPAPKPDATPAPKAQETISATDGIEALKRQLAEKDAAARAADNARHAAEQRAAEAQRQAAAGNVNLVTSELDAARRDAESAEGELAAALEKGDYREAAKIQRRISKAEAQINHLELGKQQLEAQQRAVQTQQPAVDPVDLVTRNMSPQSAAWIRAHPDLVRDQSAYRRVVAAHNYVTDLRGIQADTPEYFAAVEKELGLTKETAAGPAPAAQRTAPSAAAPVTPSAQSLSGQSLQPNQVRLSAAEASAAKDMGMSFTEYAKFKQQLIREGKMGQ